jgi:hypothetical protein
MDKLYREFKVRGPRMEMCVAAKQSNLSFEALMEAAIFLCTYWFSTLRQYRG